VPLASLLQLWNTPAAYLFQIPRGPLRHIHCKLLLAFAFLLFTLPAYAAETRGVKRVEIKTQTGELIGLYEESHALVIGVSDYTAGWPDLESVTKDVESVSAALEGQGFNVVRVLNPTKRELAAAFGDFIDQYGYDAENRLLFYYSGHGYTQELHGRPVGYLVPSDAPNPNEDRKGFSRKSLRMTQILSWSKQIEAKHALFLFDSCFSGSVLKERALVVPQQIRRVTSKPVRQFISAGSAGQTVPADSIFRPSFIRGIRGEADLDKDGYVTGTELGLFLQKRVASYDTGQTPQFGKIKDPLYDEGDFVFALPKMVTEPEPSSTAAAPASATPQASAPSEFRADEEAWKDIKNSSDPDDFRFFFEEFPASPLAQTARFKLRRLERKQAKVEQERIAKQEEERKRQEAEQRRIAEAKRKAEEEERKRLAEAKRKAAAERKRQEELAALKQKQESAGVWIESNTGMKFRRIPGGSFRMGSPSSEQDRGNDETPHTVSVGEFWLGETEVTQAQWQAIMNNNPSTFKGDDLPVEQVSWKDAQEFIRKLNNRTGKGFRLPTEAEWEYAARAGTQTARYWGDGIGRNNANCDGCGSRWDNKQTAPVRSFTPNAFGLHDMLGNVWEWTCSQYKKSYDGSEQKCAVSASTYTLRGGSWYDAPGRVRAAPRSNGLPVLRYSTLLGFRLARD
jgi:formylglycine-generating enzyme required for sulfatase activity